MRLTLIQKMQLVALALAALALVLGVRQTKKVELALDAALLREHPDWDAKEVHRLMKKYDERTLRKLYLTPGGYNAFEEHKKLREGAQACELKPAVVKVAEEKPKNKRFRS